MSHRDPDDRAAGPALDRSQIEELLEGLPSAALLLDRELQIVSFNATAERFFGLSRDVLRATIDGAHAHLEHAIEDGALLRARLNEQYALGKSVVGVECHVLAGEGREERWLACHAHCVGAGTIHEHWIEIYADVTDRARVQEALERLAAVSDEQAFILANMNAFTYRHDTQGLFHYMSPTVEAITGYPVEDWLRHYTTYMTDNPVNDSALRRTEEAMRSGEAGEPYLVEILAKGGERVLLEVAERPYFKEDEVAGLVGVALDVTERERANRERRSLEAQLQNAQKLESLGVLAGGIAHEFNNLLMAVLGNTGLALDEVPKGSKADEHLQEINSAAQRAANLCRQMLAYSGRGAFSVEPIDLSRCVSEFSEMLEATVPDDVQLSYELARGLPPMEADLGQLQQVVMNLVTNAAEACTDGTGEIHVTTGAGPYEAQQLRELEAGANVEPGEFVWLEVRDTGHGMDAKLAARIFDPFFTTRFAGRGLGLATVLGIMRGHGGALEVESSPGVGTRFRALFPAGSTRAVTPEPTVHPNAPSTGVVLFVDDEAAVRKVGASMLEKLGFEVMLASDGAEGLELFREHAAEITCVVIDVTMPDMGGDECLLAIREVRPDVPVILASGYDEAEATRRLDPAVRYGFLCKPFTREALASKLGEVTRAVIDDGFA